MDYTPNVFDKDCPSQRVLDRVADRWAALIICALHEHVVMRNGQLMRKIGGISQKMLTQTLRSLEKDGLVERQVYVSVPPKVEYRLTRLGAEVYQPLHDLCRWTEEHLAELKLIWADRDREEAANR
jgi:DNA-binding HxlR family transcriptional regulator